MRPWRHRRRARPRRALLPRKPRRHARRGARPCSPAPSSPTRSTGSARRKCARPSTPTRKAGSPDGHGRLHPPARLARRFPGDPGGLGLSRQRRDRAEAEGGDRRDHARLCRDLCDRPSRRLPALGRDDGGVRGVAPARRPLHRRRARRGDRLRPRRDRGDQPGRAKLGQANLKPGDRVLLSTLEHHSQHRALAAAPARRDRRRAADRRPSHRPRRDGGDDPARAQAGRARPCLERARLGARRQARRRHRPLRSARSCCSTAARRCRACRSTSPRSTATSTSSPATSSTARPGSACSGRAARSSTPCRPGRAAAR